MNYKQVLEDVIELNESLVIVRGYGDVHDLEVTSGTHIHYVRGFKDLTLENIWILLGKASPEDVLELLNDYECEVDKAGEYSFDIVIKYYRGEYDEYGRATASGYYDIEYVDWKFIQTFVERDREQKLNEILDIDNIFNI
mgnify:CR=1 FL=1